MTATAAQLAQIHNVDPFHMFSVWCEGVRTDGTRVRTTVMAHEAVDQDQMIALATQALDDEYEGMEGATVTASWLEP